MLLKEVIKEMIGRGSVVLFSSHQMNYVEEFCDSISILNGGRIALEGRISEIKRSYPRDRIAVTSRQCDKIAPFVIQKLSGNILSADYDKESENTLIIKMKDPAYKSELMRSLSESGLDIDGFRVVEPSMNDIFVQYTEAGI